MNTPAKWTGAIALISLCFLQATTFAGAKKVTVNNGSTNPLPVTVQNDVMTRTVDALQAYDQSQSKAANATDYIDSISFDVPAGKRLVIESITVFSNLQAGQNLWAVGYSTVVDGSSVTGHTLTVQAQGLNANDGAAFSGTHMIRGYCDGGTGTLTIGFSGNVNTGNWSIGASVTGYLVDRPTATPNKAD